MKLSRKILSLLENSEEFISYLNSKMLKEPDILTWISEPIAANKEGSKLVIPHFNQSKAINIPNFSVIVSDIYQDQYNKKPNNVNMIIEEIVQKLPNKKMAFDLVDNDSIVGKAIVTVLQAKYNKAMDVLIIEKYRV